MQRDFFKKLQNALAQERLAVYGRDGAGPAVVMARYLWNLSLCEALYSPLQMCEVALRNALNSALVEICNTDQWYSRLDLTVWGRGQITSCKQRIRKARRDVTPGRVVAELNFDFWTSLFEAHYEQFTPFLPRGIRRVFPKLPKSQHNRRFVKRRLERIRELRNRVFHHERVVHWKDLAEQHSQIIEVIYWVSPELAELSQRLDRFARVHRQGTKPWIKYLRAHWPAHN
jgi:hypothetical protein